MCCGNSYTGSDYISRGWVGRAWSRHETARRSGIRYRIVHHEVQNSDGPSWPERISLERIDTCHSTLTPKGVKPSIINILRSPVIPTTSCTFPGQKVITGLTCCYVPLIKIKYSSTNHTIQIPIRHTNERSLFTRRLLFSSHYSSLHGRLQWSIHTYNFHIPHWLLQLS